MAMPPADVNIRDWLNVRPVPWYQRRLPRSIRHFIRRKPLGAIGAVIVVLLVVTALAAPLIAPYDYSAQNLGNRLKSPSLAHPLGTDESGRDTFSRIVFGARVSVFIGVGTVTTAMILALILGGISGYAGGIADLAVQRAVDILQAIPLLILALTLASVVPKADHVRHLGPLALQPAVQGAITVILTLGLGLAIGASRVIRGSVIAITANPYIESARGLGASHGHILLRHVLPNVLPLVLVLATSLLGSAILAESSLQFLGFGVPPPLPSWGGMLSGPARTYITKAPLLSIWPGGAIALTVFGFNVLGDALRDVLDPRLRGTRD